MTKEEVICQLESLIDDRKSFLEDDGDDGIFREDIKALEKAINYIERLGKEEETYRQAIEKWGAEEQICMVFEEMAELQKELCKKLRGKENTIEIAEEIADVEIMLEQMKLLFDIEEGVEKYKKFKLERLEKRVI